MPETSASTPVEWAQRKTSIYVNFRVDDLDPSSTSVTIEPTRVSFKGKSRSSTLHELTLDLFGEVKPDDSKWFVRGRGAEIVLVKSKPDEPYWKRLLKDDKKYHWLRVDFDKWQDEDDSDDEAALGSGGQDFDFTKMMQQMGGLNPMGGGPADLDGFEDDDEDGDADSDDDKLPELEETSPTTDEGKKLSDSTDKAAETDGSTTS